MASQDELRQDTQTQQDQPVVFADANLTKLDEKKIKSIGLYTKSDLAELADLITNLQEIFPPKIGLWVGKDITLRINGETDETQLRVALDFPDQVDTQNPQARRGYLYLSDFSRIVIGLAKTLYAIWQPEILRAFTRSFDELKLLADWGEGTGTEHISEISLAQNAYKIRELLLVCANVFADYYKQTEEEGAQTASQATTPAAATTGTATVPTSIPGSKKSSADADSDTDQNQAQTQTEQDELDRKIAAEAAFVAAAAYGNLINQFLDQANINPVDLPPELQAQLKDLELILRNRLWEMIDTLPVDKKGQLPDHNLRIYLYQKLLIELLRDPEFYPMLHQFYQSYVKLIVEKNGPTAATAIVAQIDQYFNELQASEGIEADEINPVLEKIRAEIKTWKETFLAEIAAEEESPKSLSEKEQVVFDQQTLELEDVVAELPPPKIDFSPSQQIQLTTHLHATRPTATEQEQKLLHNQSARVLWGTLAELFTDNPTELSALPPELHDAVFSQTLSYLMNLSPIELEKLRTSPASLIRHIKNNSSRILAEPRFQHIFQQYTKTKLIEAVSRVDRVEKEAKWSYQQIFFELFSAHNITDETVPDESGLQDVFDDIKEYLEENLYAYMAELPTNDLLALYLNSKDRKQFLDQIYQYLNADREFIQTVSQLYTNLLVHYEKTQQLQKKTQLQTSLNQMVQLDVDGTSYRIRASTPPPEELLKSSLGNTFKTDSKVLLDLSDSTLKAMVVSLGLQATLDLIRGNNPEVLGLVFNLPQGMLREENIGDFREILMSYAKVTAAGLATTANLPEHGLMGSTAIAKKPSSIAPEQVEFVRTVQNLVQSQGKDGDEIIAEATNAKTITEKRTIVMKIFGSEWDGLSQQDQVAVYIYYGLLTREALKSTVESLQKDINNKLPFPFEYIDFRARKDYAKLLEALSTEFSLHGVENFNPLLKQGFVEGGSPAAQQQRETAKLIRDLQIIQLRELLENSEKADQLLIAQRMGFVTLEELVNHLEAQAALIEGNDEELYKEYANNEYLVDSLAAAGLGAQTGVAPSYVGAETGQPVTPQQNLLNSLKQLGGQYLPQKLKSEGLKKGAAMLAAKAGLGAATGGLATVAGFALTAVNNKKIREFFIGATTAFIASLLYSLSTIGGMGGAIIGGAAGLLGGPLGVAGGGLAGAYAGAAVWPQQWGGWMGFTPRQAPGIGSWFSSEQPIDPSQSSMSAMRAANAQAANPVNTSLAANSGLLPQGAAGPLNVGLQAPNALNVGLGSSAAGTAASTVAGSSGGLFGNFFGMPIGVATPLIGVFGAVILTLTTILVITGAFIVPLPTRDSPNLSNSDTTKDGLQPGAKFVEITKTASVQHIDNNTPTEVTYTVTVTPKGNYRLRINSIEDVFAVYGEQVPNPLPSSTFSDAYFPDLVDKATTVTYTVKVGENTADAIVSNNLLVEFDVYDRSDYQVGYNQNYRTTESIRVGDPKIACWPTSGTITQLPYNSYSHPNSSALDIGAVESTPVYATFPGTATRIDTKTDQWADGYGTSVKITSTVNGIPAAFIFAHLLSSNISIGESVQVEAGELIGLVDNTGNSDGPHLHYEVKTDPAGQLKIEDLVPDGAAVIQRFNNSNSNDDQVYDCYQQ